MAALSPLAMAEDKVVETVVTEEVPVVLPSTLTTVISDSVTFSTLTNGVMHTIGEVLVPKSLDEFADLED